MTDLKTAADEETDPPVQLVRRSLVAIIGAFEHWPSRHDDWIANRLIEAGWDVVTRLHEGQKLRTISPLRWTRAEITPFILRDDPYACPEFYLDEVKRKGDVDNAIAQILGAEPQPDTKDVPRRLQGLWCILEFEPHVRKLIGTYCTGSSLGWSDAINRLIGIGAYRILAPTRKIAFEVFDEGKGSWQPLPRLG